MSKKVVIIGAGGLASEMLEHVNYVKRSIQPTFEFLGFFVSHYYFKPSKTKMGYSVRSLNSLNELMRTQPNLEIIIAVADPFLRHEFYNFIVACASFREESDFVVVVPSRKFTSSLEPARITVGTGCIFAKGIQLTTKITIGGFTIINLNCTIGHDTIIGDFTTIHPGVNISGNVTIGSEVVIGTGSCIRDGITICDKAVIGMGSVVVNDITEPGVYFGNPCRKQKELFTGPIA